MTEFLINLSAAAVSVVLLGVLLLCALHPLLPELPEEDD